MRKYLALMALALVPLGYAQTLKLSVFDKLKDKASDVTDMTLSKDIIGFARGFLGSDKSGDSAKLKKLADGLNGILIKSLEFDKEGVYSNADLQALIAELGGAGWSLILSAEERKGHEISRIWVKTGGNGEFGGLRIMNAEPKELSVIEISGKIRLEDLKDLGDLGIPNLNIGADHTTQPTKKNDE